MSKAAKSAKPQRAAGVSIWNAIVQEEADDSLTRKQIIGAGIAIADEDGLDAVSIRRIAAQLGASPMALYHYVPSKRDLLNLMLDGTYAEFAWPAQVPRDWRDVLLHYAWECRRCLKQHAWVSLLQASDPEYGPQCIRILEWMLSSLSDFGLDVAISIRIIGVLFVFVNGFVATESWDSALSKAKRPKVPGRRPNFSKAILNTGRYPHVQQFVSMGAELPDDEGFARSLDWILNGFASEIHPRAAVALSKRKKRT